MNIVAYYVALIALMLALNRHSIKEIRNHYNKLYKDNIYGKSVAIEEYKVSPEVQNEQ